jgi:shikimate dehydrogenase
MPFKASILPFLDELSPAARLSQSVNTVVCENGRLLGHTTDGIGYMRSLQEAGHAVVGKKMTLLGAGGAGTAICVQAALDGVAEIDLFERKGHFWENALAFSQKLSAETDCKIRLNDINDRSQLKKSISESVLLTNATSLGMEPHADATPLPAPSFLFPKLVVSDVIYNPRETLFLRQAKAAGCPTLNGLPMLLYQGAAAFLLWTGEEMPVKNIQSMF